MNWKMSKWSKDRGGARTCFGSLGETGKDLMCVVKGW